VIVEIQAKRRLIREYGPDGALLRIRIEPLSVGAEGEAPRAPKRPPRSAAPEASPAKAEPVAPPPAPEAPPTPPRAFRVAPSRPRPVAIPRPARLPELIVTTEPWEPQAPPPPSPAVMPAGDIDSVLEALEEEIEAAKRQPEPTPAAPAPRFEILKVEPVAPPPVAEPEPAPAPPPEPAPPIEAPPAPEPIPDLAVETEPLAPAPPAAPEPPVPLAPRVPDLERRVDSLLAERQGRPAPRRRAPLPVPRFDPIPREAWEDRLDAVLSR